jgi:enamine deaminase RidA (YjgF/YER057c/UK114 family)
MTAPNVLCCLTTAVCLLSAGMINAQELRSIEPDDATGSAKAVIVGDVPLAHTAQLLPLDTAGNLVGKGQASLQAEKVLDNLAVALAEAKSGMDRLVKLNIYVAKQDAVGEVQRVLARRFAGPHKPAVSFVETRLPADALVAMDAVAVSALDSGQAVQVLRSAKLYATSDGPVAIVPQGSRIYVAGQAEKGKDLADATRRTLESLRATLRFLGQKEADIAQLPAFLKPMAGVEAVRKELTAFYGTQPVPPVALVEWESTLPIEIELIAWGGSKRGGEPVEYLTPPGMSASPIFSRVARINHGRSIYLSGLHGTRGPDGDAEVRDVFASLGKILEQAGSDFRHLVKATYYVSTDDASRKLNELRPRYYDAKRPPSASKAAVVGVGRAERGLTLDMIAVPAGMPERPK